ncbi:hypothetical protein E2C01_099824 [Portunus trituberculatus]|uniref:Uncharacterized protein n=1 Tax=Portunus trituberculatus TaxID=210409 RepID=A0A5B7K4S9_PORTR|nr:hypothetical protein [Portunus trituberculatus]
MTRKRRCNRSLRRREGGRGKEEGGREGGGGGAYHGLVMCDAALAGPELCLQVRGRVEVATGFSGAAALDSVHANCDCAFVTRAHMVGGVREPTLNFWPLARPTLKLPTHLQAEERPTAASPL